VGIAVAASEQQTVQTREPEAEILGIQPTEQPSMRTPKNQPTAKREDSANLGEEWSALLGWNVFDHFNTGDAIEFAGLEG
jgi:hypothetical protein